MFAVFRHRVCSPMDVAAQSRLSVAELPHGLGQHLNPIVPLPRDAGTSRRFGTATSVDDAGPASHVRRRTPS